MSSLTVNVNDQSYTGHQIRPTVKDSNNNTQITAKLTYCATSNRLCENL